MSIITVLSILLFFSTSLTSKDSQPIYDEARDAPTAIIINSSYRDPDYASRSIYERDRQAMFSIQVKNVGTQPIAAIEWEVIIRDSIRDNRVVDKFKFRTDDKTIKLGETKKFTKYIDRSPVLNYEKVYSRIVKVVFADTTTWIREKN